MSETTASLEKLLGLFERAGIELTAEEVADLLWLAARLPAGSDTPVSEPATPFPTLPPTPPPDPARPSLPPARSETFGPPVSATSTTTTTAPATAQLYPVQAGVGDGGQAARPIRSPAAAALPGSLEISRNLRPLKRRVPSRSHYVLDEPATAHHIADTGDWTPVFNPAPERWLDILVLVDESSSMLIWQRTIAELEHLLQRQGAFRNVEMLGFRANLGHSSIRIYTGIGAAADQKRARHPAELIDPLGRRLIAVVSDCVSPVWHNGVMAAVLAGWGQKGLVTLVQVLPDHLWVRTGLRTFPGVYLRSPAPGASNVQFQCEWTTYRPREVHPKGVAVPVVTLEAVSLDYWARATAGNSNLWIPGVFARPAPPAAPAAPSRADTAAVAPARTAATATPDKLVQLFYSTASPIARRLASFLAAVPLTLPIIRLVQHALLPESRQVHLAEVWLSGLIDRPAEIDEQTPPENREYYFVTGVRDLLLNNLRLSEAIDVLSVVSDYVGERIGQPLDFGALIADPAATGEAQIAAGYQSFARVAAGALRRFGGQYADLAQRLERSVYGETTATVETVPEPKVERQAKTAKARFGAVTTRALLVGVNLHVSDKIPPLRGAVEDMLLTEAWLQKKLQVASGNIHKLLDSAATKQAVIDAWRRLASQVEAGDWLFFHFSGNDQRIASNDPDEADGLEETLVVYDSLPGERATLLTHAELADLAAEVEQRGGQVVILLDSCRMASGLFTRRALDNTLVFAAAAEAERAYEKDLDGKQHGVLSFYLAEAMQGYRPGMTWLDVYDYVLAKIRATNFKQTPQLIGAKNTTVFGGETVDLPAYLVVIRADEAEIEVNAPAALGLQAGENGARLAIYPPGSRMDTAPIGYARVQRFGENGAIAVLEAPVSVPVASRARVVDYGGQPAMRVGLDDTLLKVIQPSPWFAFAPDGDGAVPMRVSLVDGVYGIIGRSGHTIWREPEPGNAGVEARAAGIRDLLEQLAAYRRILALENNHARSDLAGRVELEVVAAGPEGILTLVEAEPLRLKLRNRSATPLYVSVWMLDDYLGVQQIYPAATSSILLAEEREIQIAVAIRPVEAGDRPMRLTFKVFASVEPADMGLLALPRLDQSIDLSDLLEIRPEAAPKPAPKPAGKKAPDEGPWVPGGPVAESAKLWAPGRTLRIRFLNGDAVVQKRVFDAALEWTQYANLRFEVASEGEAELRVSFDQPGSWSYVGTDCLSIPKDKPTINLGYVTATMPEADLRSVVLHEFGHAIGLLASQNSPVAHIPWNKKAAYAYYARVGWEKKTVDEIVFKKYDPSQVVYGPPDPYSIMYHPAPKETTDGKLEIVQGKQLSEGDRQFIARVYPFTGTR